jgi:pilus assembly protein Flp/PilA
LSSRLFEATLGSSPGAPLSPLGDANHHTREGEKENIMLRRFIHETEGATAIEYGLIAGLVAVALIVGLTSLGGSLDSLFTDVSTTIDATH